MTSARLGLGAALMWQGRIAESRAEFEQILAEEPAHPHAIMFMARITMIEGDVDEARRLLDWARRLGATVTDEWLELSEEEPTPPAP